MSDYDVIIVGARVAGASTALLLGRDGLRVLVLDRGDSDSDTLSTHALTRGGVMQLKRWGLLEDLIEAGTPPIRRTTFHYGDERIALDFPEKHGVDALYAPRRTVLDPLLVRAARDAGADIRYGCTVSELVRAGDGRVAGVGYTDRSTGEATRVTGDITVGADGMRSIVARECGAGPVWSGNSAGAMVYGYFTDPGIDGYHWLYRRDATAGVIPTNGGQVCVWVGTPSGRFMSDLRGDLPAAFASLLAEAAPEFVDFFQPSLVDGRLRGYSGQPGYLRQSWGLGWALVGDAGYFKDPLTAHGITDAMRDAELLAGAVMDAIGGDDQALALYQERRDRLSKGFADVTDRIASYRWDAGSIKNLTREQGRILAEEAELLAVGA